MRLLRFLRRNTGLTTNVLARFLWRHELSPTREWNSRCGCLNCTCAEFTFLRRDYRALITYVGPEDPTYETRLDGRRNDYWRVLIEIDTHEFPGWGRHAIEDFLTQPEANIFYETLVDDASVYFTERLL